MTLNSTNEEFARYHGYVGFLSWWLSVDHFQNIASATANGSRLELIMK
jgi:hypothetical protein